MGMGTVCPEGFGQPIDDMDIGVSVLYGVRVTGFSVLAVGVKRKGPFLTHEMRSNLPQLVSSAKLCLCYKDGRSLVCYGSLTADLQGDLVSGTVVFCSF